MGYFAPDPDASPGYFSAADLSGLKLGDLSKLMPFGVPLEVIGSVPLGPGTGTDDGGEQVAGGLPCAGPYCQSGGTRGMTGIYDLGGKPACWDCAVKLEGIENLSGAEKAEHLAPFLIGGDGLGGGGVGVNPKLGRRRIQRRY